MAFDVDALTIGSSMVRGRSVRMRATASLTSLSARSVSTSSRNSMVVVDDAFGDRRGDVLDAGDAGDRVLDPLGDLRLELGRRGARTG